MKLRITIGLVVAALASLAQANMDTEYPIMTPIPTFNHINDTEMLLAAQCIDQWCNEDEFLDAHTGKMRCSTQTEATLAGGEAMVAFVCNLGGKARCSGYQIVKTLALLRKTGSPSGWTKLQTSREMGFYFGFDRWCPGGSGSRCGSLYDPVALACDRNNEWTRGVPIQVDRRISFAPKGGEYHGTRWATQAATAAATATRGHLGYATVAPPATPSP
ncbi:hypothetical protein B0T26DRAFT_753974 [Lasiosphaeria miniovina]|uniref:Uncharacterized protein n=1 Tax=Lasiosphaeria miniovina TaxID=1954250 RepID=A0AA40DUJ0_9PEZI|nr:uncharacterized protein B0T26DRAFT_753974 [Lasiosphaeria miniovina]KAK0713917.1 hypothetical protein B0T26DRAFT_753974 [Lasiosphaeria miniovina]